MYVRITTGTFDPAKEAELQQLTDEKYIPLIRQLPGFHSYLSGIDRAAEAFPTAIGGLVDEFVAASLRPSVGRN